MENTKIETGLYSWKEICAFYGWETTGGTYRKAREKELTSKCSWEKERRKIRIRHVYETQIPVLSSGKYAKDIQLLLLNILSYSQNGMLEITANNLMELLNMVNEEYKKYYINKKALSTKIDVKNEYCYEIYSIVSRYKQVVNNALKDLQDKKLITYNMVDIISYNEEVEEIVDENTVIIKHKESFREPTKEESQLILKIEREEMAKVGINDMKEFIYKIEEGDIYRKNVSRLLKRYNINYKFKTYRIIYNYEFIKDELQKNEIELNNIKNRLNKNVYDGILKTVCSNKKNTIDGLDVSVYTKRELRKTFQIYNPLIYEDDYIDKCTKVAKEICLNVK